MPLFPAQQFILNAKPRFVASGDLQGDGVPDLVVGHYRTISVLLGEGNGSFAAPIQYGSGSISLSHVLDDLDGDTDLDVVVADFGDERTYEGAVHILLNNGDGTFADPVTYTFNGNAFFVVSKDLDGDGDADLAVSVELGPTASSNGRVVVLMGNGDGTFRTAGNYAVGGTPRSIAVADLDGDGDADLAAANAASSDVSILLNHGDGSFAAAVNYPVGDDARSIAIDDLNGDGHADLVVANRISDNISVSLGNGDGTFSSPTFYPAHLAKFISIDDLDHDGDLDLAVALEECVGGGHGHCIAVFLNIGDGSFEPAINIFAGLEPAALSIDDYDLDGHADLAVINGDSNSKTATLLLGHGDGTFNAPTMYDWESSLGVAGSADLNDDGQPDLVLWSGIADTFAVVLGNGDGTFDDPLTYPLGFDPKGMAMDDLDADGDVDLAIGTEIIGSGLRVSLGNGDATFAPAVPYYAGGRVRSVTIADLDRDNVLDITVTNWNIDKVSVLLGNGNGTFKYVASYATGNSPLSVAIGDLNGDGNPDLAVGCPSSITDSQGVLSVLLGNGDGDFAPAVNYPTGSMGSGPRSLVLGDLDSDGDLDVAAAHYHYASTSHALVFFNNGDGTFATPVIYDPVTHAGSVAIDDLNGDGILDLAVGRAVHKTTTLLLGNGDGTFLPPLLYATGGGTTFVDLDHDGDKDLVGAFQAGVLVSMNSSCAVGDLNEDGVVNDADLAILLGSWGPCPEPPGSCPADLDNDGTVGATDLLILLVNWG